MSDRPVLLFVDDEPAILNALKRVLRKEAFELRFSNTAAEALAILERETITLVVADLQMPGVRGTELLEEVASRYPDVGRILMSGNADLPSLVDAVNRGQLMFYFEKPWSDDALRVALRELVERLELQKQNRELLETIQRQNETLMQQSEIQHRFFAMMSHEIRTPLNGVAEMLQILQQKRLSPEDQRLIDTAIVSADHLGQIVNDVLDFSRIEAGEFEISHQSIDIRGLLQDVLNALSPLAKQQGLVLRLEADMIPGEFHALGDELRLRQVLLNLVGNAIKFTQQGSVCIKVIACEDKRQRIDVIDTGVGIPEDQIPNLFQAYRQGVGRETRRAEGSGLGLSIAHQIIELMGGRLTVASREGEGTIFSINLALPATEPLASRKEPAQENISLAGRRFLVVDDNPTNRLVVTAMLEPLHAEVREAASGEEALQLLADAVGPVDLVFMDISMEGMDGIETLQRIRQQALLPASVPVIAMSAHVQPEEQARFLAAGMSGFLGKPFSRAALMAVLGTHQPGVDQVDKVSARGSHVDPAVYGDLANSIGEAAMPRMIASFRSDAEAREIAISSALAEAHWQRVSAEAHALGSSAGMFGAMALHQCCRELEAAFKAQEIERIPDLATSLLSLIRPSIDAVDRLQDASATG
ncbi:MAG: response regulator [Proteobacteria bacterium]|nr:response regulator [Pseudomonadota bacterium]